MVRKLHVLHGLRLSGTCGDHVIRVKAIHVHELQSVTQPFDAAFVAVKSYDTEWATALVLPYLARPDGVVVDFQNGINDERVAAVAGRGRTLGCVITIGAGLYEAGHAMRTDRQSVGFKIGELNGKDSERAQRLVGVMNDVAGSKVTTNLFGERWSKLTVNCMANPIAGLSGLGSAESAAYQGRRVSQSSLPPRQSASGVGAASRSSPSTALTPSASWTPPAGAVRTSCWLTWPPAPRGWQEGGHPCSRT